ncbi:MAG: alpha/beta hydrolase, partial [Cytophagales bacterium]|nr:alpha/beta hydrolase [Cytophaga sp.]
ILPIYDGTLGKDGLDGLVSYLHEIVTELDLERFSLVGNSLGGQVAILYTHAYPQNVARLVLTGSAGLYESTMGASYPKRGDYAYIEEKVRYTFHNDGIVTRTLVDQVFETVNDIRKSIRVIKIVRAANGNNVSELLKQITTPTLLIWGREDRITPLDIAYRFQKLLSGGAELRIIDNCGHAPMMERPDDFNAILDEYLHTDEFAYAVKQVG